MGSAFATANPSTFAALAGGGLLAAAKAVPDAEEVTRDTALTIARAVADSIRTRGKAELGDKTVLDALVPSLEALERAGGDDHAALGAMVDAARNGVAESASSLSRRGRASWLQERSAGRPDPGRPPTCVSWSRSSPRARRSGRERPSAVQCSCGGA